MATWGWLQKWVNLLVKCKTNTINIMFLAWYATIESLTLHNNFEWRNWFHWSMAPISITFTNWSDSKRPLDIICAVGGFQHILTPKA